jgi:hypothetical protein
VPRIHSLFSHSCFLLTILQTGSAWEYVDITLPWRTSLPMFLGGFDGSLHRTLFTGDSVESEFSVRLCSHWDTPLRHRSLLLALSGRIGISRVTNLVITTVSNVVGFRSVEKQSRGS